MILPAHERPQETQTPIGVSEAKALLGEIVDRYGPNTRYTPFNGRSSYRHGDTPGCLIGIMLAECGWTLDELSLVEGMAPNSIDTQPQKPSQRQIENWFRVERARPLWGRFTHGARQLMTVVQEYQDAGSTWEASLLAAGIEYRTYD